MSNDVYVCQKRGLHSLRLLPYYPALKAHLDVLEAMPTAAFAKPAHLASLDEGLALLEDDLARSSTKSGPAWSDWRRKVRVGHERLMNTLWQVAKEFDVRGYGLVLREKLTTKWCDCGCSTDHLGEVCERTVREEEEESGVRSGKEKEWDGRGTDLHGYRRKHVYTVCLSQEAEYLVGRLTRKKIYGNWTLTSVGLNLKSVMNSIQK